MVRTLLLTLSLALPVACGSSGSTPPASCSATVSCPAGQACIRGGTCETRCGLDGGSACPDGGTCQSTSGYCQGTECSAIGVNVCLLPDGGA